MTCHGKPVARRVAERAFACLRRHARVCRTDGFQQPRLHDLRHALQHIALSLGIEKGADVQAWLPKLATYLGHL